ncbi:hypothetical protein [Kosakonia sp. WA-90]|uniref:hypothetical protein n=1 Tax=Kosakonia sp. WA-90 TaxID=3153576 RepID=UPI00325E0B3E
MYTGIALYGTEQVSPASALALGMTLFKHAALEVSSCGWNQYVQPGDHPGDHDLIESTLDALREKVAAQQINAFRLYSEKPGALPWSASFGVSTAEFGQFHHIDMQLPACGDMAALLRMVACEIHFDYGIAYHCDTVSKAYYYAAGENLVSVCGCENPALFKRETPGRFRGAERYRRSMLRMIYPVNVVNRHHLAQPVMGMPLQTWIATTGAGGIEHLQNDLWLWTVSDARIAEVNQTLGEAGLLIAWKGGDATKTRKRLP